MSINPIDPVRGSSSPISFQRIEESKVSPVANNPDYPTQKVPSEEIQPHSVPHIVIDHKKVMPTSAKEQLNRIKHWGISAYHVVYEPAKITLENVAHHVEGMEFGLTALEAGFAIPRIVYKTYSLAKNWKKTSVPQKAFSGASILNSHIAAAGAIASLVHLAPGVAEVASLGAAKASAVLGPIGLGLASVLFSIKGTISAVKSHRAGKQFDAADQLLSTSKLRNSPSLLRNLLIREKVRFLALRRFEAFSSLQSFLVAAGLGAVAIAAALVTLGVVAATVSTPVGWALLGIILASSLIGLGVYAYRRHQAKKMAEIEQNLLIGKISEQIQSNPLPERVEAIKLELDFLKRQPTHGNILLLRQLLSENILKQVLGKENLPDMSNPLLAIKPVDPKKWQAAGLDIKDIDLKNLTIGKFQDLLDSYLQDVTKDDEGIERWEKKAEKLINAEKKALQQEAETLVAKEIEGLLISEMGKLDLKDPNFAVMIGHKEGADMQESIAAYAKKVATSSIWPKNPTLAHEVANKILNP